MRASNVHDAPISVAMSAETAAPYAIPHAVDSKIGRPRRCICIDTRLPTGRDQRGTEAERDSRGGIASVARREDLGHEQQHDAADAERRADEGAP